MRIPSAEIVPFTDFYLSLFNPKTKDRVDPMDRGGEYRSLIGLPGRWSSRKSYCFAVSDPQLTSGNVPKFLFSKGGTQHTAFPEMQAAAEKAGFRLVAGKGNDPDTLGKQIVYVYDTKEFPFYQAEVYHQFHNDFQSPPYGEF